MDEITIKFSVNLKTLNNYLGNTSNVTVERAMTELLNSMFTEQDFYCERCGTAHKEETNIKGSFEVVKRG